MLQQKLNHTEAFDATATHCKSRKKLFIVSLSKEAGKTMIASINKRVGIYTCVCRCLLL